MADDLPDWSDLSDYELLTSASIDLDKAHTAPPDQREGKATRALAKLLQWKKRQRQDDDTDDIDIYDDDVQEGMFWASVSKQVEDGYFDGDDTDA